MLLKTVADGVSDEEEGGAVAVEDDEAEDEDEDEDVVDELEIEPDAAAEVVLPAAALLVPEVVVLADTPAEVMTVVNIQMWHSYTFLPWDFGEVSYTSYATLDSLIVSFLIVRYLIVYYLLNRTRLEMP